MTERSVIYGARGRRKKVGGSCSGRFVEGGRERRDVEPGVWPVGER